MRLYIVVFLTLLLYAAQATAENALKLLNGLNAASLLVVDQNGQQLLKKNPDRLLIPASTVKLLTSLAALEYWGDAHRFTTEFYIDSDTNYLWVRGLGDPYLVSEELDLIVAKLATLQLVKLAGIGVDNSFFADNIFFSGQGNSNNPYDASVSALAANFNTIKVRVTADNISSGESQTPITPMAKKLAKQLPIGTHRINLGDSKHGPYYFAELLAAKLNAAGIIVDDKISQTTMPQKAELLYLHHNSRPLEQLIAAMLEYSNNFIANQLYLLLGAELYGAPAHPDKSRRFFKEYVTKRYSWLDYELQDGTGLSKQNRMSARQLLDVLQDFKKYRYLMPVQNQSIRAKTGTLKHISTYAGYLHREDGWAMFALLINQPVKYNYREQLAEELLSRE